MGFVDPFYAYYDSKLLKKRSPHVPADRLAKDIAEYKRLGVRILGVYPPCLQGEVYETHPEWRRIDTNMTQDSEHRHGEIPSWGNVVPAGPVRRFLHRRAGRDSHAVSRRRRLQLRRPALWRASAIANIAATNFRHDTGGEIPNADLNDPAFRRYQHWADRRMEDCIRRMQTRLKTIKPERGVGHLDDERRSIWPLSQHSAEHAHADEPAAWMRRIRNSGSTRPTAAPRSCRPIANAYIWATTNHRVAFSEPYLMTHGNPYGKDSFPPQEILRRMLLAVTYGAQPSLAIGQPANLQDEVYKCLAEIERRKPWITHKHPEPWGALLLSDNTRNFYGRSAGQVEERYMAHVFGAFRTAVEEHLPIAIVNDWNLNPADLARYKVLILPNAACLDEAQTAAIEGFVRAGGGLVATVDTSLFNEFGDPRANFALAKVFGVDYQGLPTPAAASQDIDVNFAKGIGPDYWEKRKNVFDFKQDTQSLLNEGLMKTYVGDTQVTFKGAAVRVAPNGAQTRVIGTLRGKSRGAAT